MSFDPAPANAAFAEKYAFPFPLLCDVDRAMGVAYGAADDPTAPTARRTGVIIDPSGRVLFWQAKVDASTFPQQALALLP